jgi:hypothetical protein
LRPLPLCGKFKIDNLAETMIMAQKRNRTSLSQFGTITAIVISKKDVLDITLPKIFPEETISGGKMALSREQFAENLKRCTGYLREKIAGFAGIKCRTRTGILRF